MNQRYIPSAPTDYQLESARWSTGRNALVLAALISIVACIAGYIQDPDRFFRSYLVAFTLHLRDRPGALSSSSWCSF